MTTSNETVTLSKKTLNSVYWRWQIWGQIGWNYEKMQGSGYCYAMLPVLKQIYTDPDELQEAVKNHLQFFNTTPQCAQLILGINCALEPELKLAGKDVISGIKTGLMGPLAGVGDSIFGVIIPTIMGSIAAYMALDGNPLGVILWVVVNYLLLFVNRWLFHLGYTQGQGSIDTVSKAMKPITNAASILGLCVVGALVCSVVSVEAAATFTMGDVSMSLQEMLDTIMPGILSVVSVALVYVLLNRKGMTSTKAIIIVCVVGIILGAIGILG